MALLLLNPNARRGGEGREEIIEGLSTRGVDVVEPDKGLDGGDAIRSHAGQVDFVIIGGGDGTLGTVAQALMETGLTLGVLPLGTANDFARTMGIPPDIEQAMTIIAEGHSVRIDLGQANGLLFFNVASIGLSGKLARALTPEIKKKWGKIGYAVTSARILMKTRPFSAVLRHDGTLERFRTLQLAVGNGRYYGGGMSVKEDASATDGLLDFYSIEVRHWWYLLALLPSLRRGTHGRSKHVRSFSTKELRVETRRARPVNLDGDIRTTTPVDFIVREKAISVFVPSSVGPQPTKKHRRRSDN